ncbi:MAG TPA: outer membrane beta-barrel protein [Blastocatellia bacterium]|nr:outer membrane beta-barrel protein [Blastocatellia bacterium]
MFTQLMMRRSAMCLALGLSFGAAFAQTPVVSQTMRAQLTSAESESKSVKGDKQAGKAEKEKQDASSLAEEMRGMRQLIEQMRQTIERQEARISQLEAEKSASAAGPASTTDKAAPTSKDTSPAAPGSGQAKPAGIESKDTSNQAQASKDASKDTSKDTSTSKDNSKLSTEDRETLDFWRDTTVNLTVDGYYGYNFNRTLGGINLLRANDVLINSFSLNQATVILEQAPNVDAGRRFGARLDLMFGQETETVQGSAVNELRPQVYRYIWQAYGTYVAPLGNGLTVDFGKFASSLGYETNYAKDNFNYSRSYFFNFLPFYHLGFRAKYPVNDQLTVLYHLVNGINQSEDFNGFKSQHVAFMAKPGKRVTAQFNYYVGQEQRVRTSILNPTFPVLPTQPGLSPVEIHPEARGRFHILDAYATFNVTDKLTFALECDYVINRVFRNSPPLRVTGGVAYARYQFTPHFAMAGRFEYLSDRVGLFSGLGQALKEHTLTAEYKFGEGFLLRGEYRRDFSNLPFFLTDFPGVLKKEQNTATLGLVWWWGRKKGPW